MQTFASKTNILSKNRERIAWKRTKSLPDDENELFDPQRRPAQGRSWPDPTPPGIGDHCRDRPNFRSLEAPSFAEIPADLKETTSDPIIEEAMAAPKILRTVKIAEEEEEEWDEENSVARNESEKCDWVYKAKTKINVFGFFFAR
jgi:hypothetical protein